MMHLRIPVAVLLIAAVRMDGVRGQSERDLARQVRTLFAAKCASCHGPDLPKPKGRFGYVLDLPRVADNPEMVIRGSPDESELWVLVRNDEMPPSDSPSGPLTSKQKAVIREWIAHGAPNIASEAPPLSVPEKDINTTELTAGDRVIRWLGKFHLLFLHFPIALGFAALVAEGAWLWKRSFVSAEVVRFCVWLAAAAALPTALLGWLFAASGHGVGSPQLLTAHRWLGTAAALSLGVAAVCVERDARIGTRRPLARLLLIGAMTMIVLTAHLGGLLAHGSDFFDY
jgi:hypothetical protein